MRTTETTTKQTLRIYWQHAKQYPRQLAGIFVAMPALQFVEDFYVPLLISRIMTDIAGTTGALDLGQYMGPLLVIFVLELGMSFGWRPYVKNVWRFEENVMRDLYNSSFEHLMKMSYRFYTNRFAGSLVSQVNKFSSAFERLADSMIWNAYKLVISFILTVVLLAKPAPLYVLVLAIFSGLFVAILLYVKKSERPLTKRWARAESDRTGQLADSIGNILAVKSFAHEKLEEKLFDQKAKQVHKRSMETMQRVMFNEGFTITSQRAINLGAIVSSLYLATKLSIPIGTIYLVLIYTTAIMRRLWDLNNTLRNLNRVFGDAADMTEMLSITPEVADIPNAPRLKSIRGDIVLDKVVFAYPEKPEEPLFKDLSLHIKSGEKVGLVGHSGSGKTSITNLLLRFMDLESGSIRIDGQNIAEVSQDSLRQAIAFVPQEPLMFHRSIRDNIAYGQLDAEEAQIQGAAKMAHANEFIDHLQHGYDTLVGERGTKLSGGQRQRIAIARAMIKNAPILILDEATSALDSESEVLIQDALWKLMERRTAIVIAHRLSTIQKMDRILVMDEGSIVEEGSHKELIAQNGIYAELWAHQSGGFIDE